MESIKMSYIITACDEIEELSKLLDLLIPVVKDSDQVIVQLDNTSDKFTDMEKLVETKKFKCGFMVISYTFDKDFAEMKNNAIDFCTGDYILQLDADETIGNGLLYNIRDLIDDNRDVDAFYIPRINTVKGITDEYIQRVGWSKDITPVHDLPLINFPDYQMRLWRVKENVRWAGKVHERLTGDIHKYAYVLDPQSINEFTNLNLDDFWSLVENWSIHHHKTFDKQIKQNELYETI